MKGFQWLYESDNNDELSIIFHDGSYGREAGLFETKCSWLPDVQGFLSFGQVQQTARRLKIKRLIHVTDGLEGSTFDSGKANGQCQ